MNLKLILAAVATLVLLYASSAPFAAARQPNDVSAFIKQKQDCDSMRGEIPDPDPNDPGNVERSVAEINSTCEGLDDKLKALKKRYINNHSVLQRLSQPDVNTEHD